MKYLLKSKILAFNPQYLSFSTKISFSGIAIQLLDPWLDANQNSPYHSVINHIVSLTKEEL